MKNRILSFALPLLLALPPASASAARLLWVGVEGGAAIDGMAETVGEYQSGALNAFRVSVPDGDATDYLVFAHEDAQGQMVVADTAPVVRALDFANGDVLWAPLVLSDGCTDTNLAVTLELGNDDGSSFVPLAVATESLGNLLDAPHVSIQGDLNPPALTPWTPEVYSPLAWTISYELDGGVNHADNPAGYTAADLPITLLDATREGYTFAGWTNEAGTVVDTIAVGTTGDLAFGAAWLENVEPPTGTNYSYDGTSKTGVPAGTGYTLSGDATATAAGPYTATATLDAGYAWSDGTTADKTVTWTIEQITASVTIVGANAETVFDGASHGVNGYTATASTALFDVDTDIAFSGTATASRTVVGKTDMGLTAAQFANTNPNFSTVTFTVTDGFQTITPKAITVTVTGTASSSVYTGSEQTGTVAYTLVCNDPLFNAANVSFSGTATVTGTAVGNYNYGLAAGQFSYNDANINATFDVTDAAFSITKASITVTVTGTASSATYTGSEQTGTVAYTLASEDALFDASKVSYSGVAAVTGTTVASYEYGLDAGDFSYNDANIDATFDVTDAAFTITKASITITVTGMASSATYTGSEQTGTVAYTLASEDALYDVSKVAFSGEPTVAGTTVGSYAYGLDESDFSYADDNITATFSVTDAAFAITPASIAVTVTGTASSATYTGSEQTGTVAYTLASEDALYDASKVNYSGASTVVGTTVGSYAYGLDEGDFSYDDDNITATFTVTDAAFAITPASIAVTVTGTASSATYTGSEQTGTVAYTLASEDALYDASKVNYSGASTVVGTTVGSYAYGLDDSDFSYADDNITATFTVTDAAFAITPASIAVTVTGTASSATYTGAEQTGTVAYTLACEDALYDASKVSYSGAATVAGTTVGSYAYGLDDSDFSYDDDNITATFTVTDAAFAITPASIAVTVTGTASSATYTGAEQTGTVGYTLACEDALYDASKVTYSGAATVVGTTVGSYAYGLDDSDFAYADENITATFTVTDAAFAITPASIAVAVTGTASSSTYTGSEQTGTVAYTLACEDALYDASKVTYSGAATVAGTTVGSYEYGLDATDFAYADDNIAASFTVTDAAFAITPASIAVAVTGTASSATYTGAEQTGTVAYTLACEDALYDASKVNYSGAATVVGTTVGSYAYGLDEGDFTYADDNITATFTVTDAAFAITPATIAITVTGTASSSTYTGSEQTGTVAYTLASEDALYDASKVTYSGASTVVGTTVGSYAYGLDEGDFTYADDNITATFTVTDAAFAITPASIAVTVTGTASSSTYTGSEQTGTVAYTLASEDALYDASKVNYSGAATVAGTTVGSYAYGLDDSDFAYADDNITATFTVTDAAFAITPASIAVTVTGTASSATYTGSEQPGTVAYTLASEDALYDASKVNYSGAATVAGTTVGSYAYGLDDSDFAYADDNITATFTVTDAAFAITPASIAVTVTGTASSATYTGSEQTGTVAYALSSGDALYDASKVVYSGATTVAGTAVGSYAYGLTASDFTYDDANIDATFDVTDAAFAITSASMTVTVAGTASSAVYTGSEQTGTVAYTLASEDALYDESKVVFSGAATVAGTAVGDYAYGLTAAQFSYDDAGVEVAFTVTDANFSITPAAVTVTADDLSKVAGNADPELTATVSGLFGSDTVSYTLARVAGEAVGTYAITPSGDAAQGNYTVSYVPGAFTISGAVAARISADGTSTNYYATLASAVGAAQDGDTVQLLSDVTLDARVEPNLGAGTSLTIDLDGHTITREGTSGNGSAFDVKSGSVTIANGTIDCTQDDAAIAKDGVYAITVRGGADVTLADLEVSVDSECGACAYPFADASLTIESGTYANVTTVPYRYKTAWTGMAVNQANVADQLITIVGGTFSQVDPALGDDSAAAGAMSFIDPDYVSVPENGTYVVHEAVTVTFVTDKGDAPAAQKIAKGGTATEPVPAPECEGWAFNFWAFEGTEYDFSSAVAEDIELVANWTPTVQTVTFDPSPYGTFRGEPTTNRTFEIGGTYHDLPNTTPDGTHARIGWYTMPDGQGGEPVVDGDDVTVEATRTLYAHWTDKQTVTFDAQNGTVPSTRVYTVGGRYGSLPTPKWAGHAFLGWFTEATGGKKLSSTSIVTTRPARTLHAHWTTEQTVVFDAQGGECDPGTMIATIGGRYGSLPKPTRSGYAFAGWYTKAEGGNHLTANSIVTAQETRTFYAQWTNEQTVIFDACGGEVTPSTKVAEMGGRYGQLPTPEWEYHVFLGWYTEADGGKKLSSGSLVTTAKTRTMYAHWLNEQVVTFEPLNGTESWTEVYTMGERFGSLPKPTWNAHAFLGWFSEPDGGNHFTWCSIVTTARARTMYGHWTTNQVVTFDAQGGECDTETMVVTIGGPYGELPVPVKEGQKFLGWYTRVDGGMKMSAARVVNTVATRTLYAHWEEQQPRGRGLAITGFSSKKAGGAAPRGTRGQTGLVLTFEAEAGCVYELQWTPMLGGEWTTVRRWTADADGEARVEVPDNSGAASGFYRLAMPAVDGE